VNPSTPVASQASPVAQPGEALAVTRIEARTGFAALKLRELWDNRELVGFLVWRDIKVRYKQTALGATWAVLQPVLTMIVFSVFFGKLAKLDSDGVPYPIFSFAALLPWNLFAGGMTGAANSLVGNSALLKKVYLPRLAIPLGSVLAVFVDFAIAMCVLAVLMVCYHVTPTARIALVIPLVVVTMSISLGAGAWLAALNVKYRDVKYVLPFIVQLWMFSTPVAYSSSLIKSDLAKTVYSINPMVAVVDGFRYALVGTPPPSITTLITSASTALLMLLTGLFYFRQTERSFADVI
jgi:lipopolysaccharide transport system permease protein